MKVAWIGVIGIIIGALIGVFGTPVLKNIMEGPPEGVFTVELNYISEYQIPKQLRNQIDEYPCSVKIIHLEGPPVEGLAVTMYSENKLSNVTVRQSDETINPILEEQNKKLQIDVENLRKNSVIEVGFSSAGPPEIRENIVMSKGRLLGATPAESKDPWYESEYFVVPSVVLGFGLFLLISFYSLRKYAEPHMLTLNTERFKLYAAVASVIAIFPLYSNIALVFVIYALVKILNEISLGMGSLQNSNEKHKTTKALQTVEEGVDKELIPKNSIPNLLPYVSKFQFLEDIPLKIDSPTKKVKIQPEFLKWDRFTIIFWVKITEDFFNSYNNRYLFSYSTDPRTKEGEKNYPNAFFLGILGGKLDWRFIIKGNDPNKETKIIFSSNEGLKGWKMFSIRWHSSRKKLRLSIDAGKVYNNSKTISPEFWPVSSPDHQFHLGGWDDNWLGGISMLKFFNYRIFDYHFTDGELLDCYDAEKPEYNEVKKS